MDLRKQIGGNSRSPLRHTLHSQAMQQDRYRYEDRSRSPYDQPTRDYRDPYMGGARDPVSDARFIPRQTQEIPGSTYGDSLHKVDERHDELRK